MSLHDTPIIDVRLRDRETGERLYDGDIALINAHGEVILSFAGDYAVSGPINERGEIEPLEPGEYQLVEQRAPRSPADPPEDANDANYAPPYSIATPVAITIHGSSDRQSIEILHDRTTVRPGPASADDEGEALIGKVPRPSIPRRFRGWVVGFVFGERVKRRSSADARRLTLCRIWTLAIILCVVLMGWILAPALWMTAFGLLSLFAPGFGLQFAFGNLADYVLGGYVFSGWRAVGAISAAYTVPLAVPMTTAIASIVCLVILLRVVNTRIGKEALKNDLLDSLPPAAGHNECGSARFVREPAEIAETLKTCDAKIPCGSLEYAGPVFGFLEASMVKTAPQLIKSDIMALKERIEHVGHADRCHVAPRSHLDYIVTADKFVFSDGDENTLIIGDTRAGKTRRELLATIDLLTRAKKESLLILDPKGELYALASEMIMERRIPVNRIDFRFPRFSRRWNPMQHIIAAANKAREAARAGDERALLEAYDTMFASAEDLVLMILPKENDIGPNTFFNQGARSYIKSVMLFVASWDNCPDNQRSLATVSRIIDNYGPARTTEADSPMAEKLTPYVWMLDYLPRNHPAFEAFSNARSANDKERSQFVTTALGALQDYRDSNIAAMTSDTDVPLKQLGLERSVTFLIIPHEKSTYSAFATLYIQQAYQALIEESTVHGGRLPYRVNFLCEEFGQIPPLTDLDKKLSTSLSAGIRWIIVLQSIAQLITVYGRGYDDIVKTNCENKIIIKTTDAENTGKWFSALAGKYTISIEGGTLSGKRLALWKDSSSKSVRLAARDLIDPSEVSRWRADYGALMHRGASNGVYVIPLPDVSRTPTQEAMGLGDMEHNRKKTERVLYGSKPPEREVIDPWSPELKKMKEKTARGERYTDDEKRIAEAVFIDQLIQRRNEARRRGKRSAVKPTDKKMPARSYGCLLDPVSFRSTPVVPIASDEYLSALQEHPTWERIEMAEEHAVKNALGQRKRTILERREKAHGEMAASAPTKPPSVGVKTVAPAAPRPRPVPAKPDKDGRGGWL